MMNHVKITVCNADYKIATDDPPAYVLEIARQTDHDITEIMNKSDRVSLNMAAVLTAVRNADRACKAERAADNLRAQLKEALDELARLRPRQSGNQQLQF